MQYFIGFVIGMIIGGFIVFVFYWRQRSESEPLQRFVSEPLWRLV